MQWNENGSQCESVNNFFISDMENAMQIKMAVNVKVIIISLFQIQYMQWNQNGSECESDNNFVISDTVIAVKWKWQWMWTC